MSEQLLFFEMSGDKLEIVLPSKLTTKLWFEEMGYIQSQISKSGLLNVFVDFSHCVWADPFPLMSLSLSLNYFVLSGGCVSILIPLCEKDCQNTNTFKFLKFLAQEGFLSQFCEHFVVSNGRGMVSRQEINEYLHNETKLTYTDSELLPFIMIDLYKKDDISGYVDNLIEQQISIRLRNKLSDNVYKKTLANAFHCLCELIENVKMHAYEGISEQYVGVYVRYRKGNRPVKAEEQSREQAEELKKSIRVECNNSPSLDTDMLLNSDSLIEIFVVDVGIGLQGSLKSEYTYPTRELFQHILKDGRRRNQIQPMSAYGGLYFITRLLEENGGYIWCKNHKELVGGYGTEILDKTSNRIRSTIDCANYHVPGLCWCVRLSCTDEDKLKGAYYKLFSGAATEHPAYKAYCNEAKRFDFLRFFCVDDRKIIENCATMMASKEELTFLKRDSKAIFVEDYEVEEYLWFPKEKMTKNILIFELKKYMEFFVNIFELSPIEQKELTIFDVQNSQLLTYYNALNALREDLISSDHIDKITVIGEHFEVMCFVKENGVFRDVNFSIDESSQEFSDLLYIKIDLLRKYDSYIFWILVNKYNTDNLLFISDKIQWSPKKVISGYLDFDNLYSFAPFLILLIKTLERVKGLFYNAKVSFCDIDAIPKRICNDVNSPYLYSDRGTVNFVNVGSVWVSGYSKNAFASDNSAKFDVHFFLHGESVVETICEAFLLIWPTSGIVPKSDSDLITWKRLGKTNYIGKISPPPTIIDSSESYYRNSEKGKREGYFDLQKKYPAFSKIGHYSTDNHHYFLAFDFSPIIKLSYFQRDGLFVFLLCQIFYRLVQEKDHNNILREMTQNSNGAWVEIIRKNKNKYIHIEKASIVLYHSNSYTEYAINYLKQVFPESLNRKILPVNVFSVQKKGMPPALSINTIGKILNVLEESKLESKSVLYFDSIISTGQTISIIRNILSSATKRELIFSSLSILDTQRLPYVDSTTNTYWKFNMPRMDRIDECVLCSSLEKANTFQSMVILEYKQRINEWAIAWNPINVAKSLPGAGLAVEFFTLETNQGGTKKSIITNSIGKIMQVIEFVCETYENDYAVKICTKDKDLCTSIKIQILCSQIILFGNQKSRNLQQAIILYIMSYMTDKSISDNCSSLAALVLLNQEQDMIYNVLNEIYNSISPEIVEIRKAIDKTNSKDLILVFAFFMKTYKSISELSTKLTLSFPKSIMKTASNVLLMDREFKNICKEFHALLYNENGGNHNVEIQKTLSESSDSFSEFKARYGRLKETINILSEYAERLPSAYRNKYLVKFAFSFDEINTLKSDLLSAIASDIQINEKIYGYKEYDPDTRIAISIEVRERLTKINEQYQNFHKSYFVYDCKETREYLTNMVAQTRRRYAKRINIEFFDDELLKDTGKKFKWEKWYFWNSAIENEFEYLLNNVEHSKMIFKDGKDEIDMKIEVHFSRTKLSLCTISFSDKPALTVDSDFTEKGRMQKEQAGQFDVLFYFTNPDSHIFEDGQLSMFNVEHTPNITCIHTDNCEKLKSEMIVPAVFGNYIRR